MRNWRSSGLLPRLRSALPIIIFGLLALFAIHPWISPHSGGAAPRAIVLYGFSILGEVMNEGVFPAFREEWRERTGEEVELISSFAGSGTVTNQIIMGVPAQIVLLATELDAQRLADADLTQPRSWRNLPCGGVVNRSPFVIFVRGGNPKRIADFSDLTRPGIGIIHPDPMTSGGANWAVVAEYGAGLRQNPSNPEAGYQLLLGIWKNIAALSASARGARTEFEQGFGDALITYEQEAVRDKARSRFKLEVVYPRRTILSEHTLLLLDHNIAPGERELVEAFANFMWSEKAQRIFVNYGFRSVDESLNLENPEFGKIQDPFLIEDLGGWPEAKKRIIDGIWKNRVLKDLKQ